VRQYKRLSQVFLNSPAIARLIADAIPLKGKRVLEIGAGAGALTRELAERAKHVTALEIDSRLAEKLAGDFSKVKNVTVMRGDALEYSFDGFDAIYGNLPYHLSSPLLFRFLESRTPLAVFMLQKEFVQRLSALPDSREYSRLTVMTAAYADAETIGFVPAECFDPKPRVDSAIVKLERHEAAPVDANLVNALFQHKNQSVRNALRHSERQLSKSKGELADFSDSLALKERKVRSLTVEELVELSQAFNSVR